MGLSMAAKLDKWNKDGSKVEHRSVVMWANFQTWTRRVSQERGQLCDRAGEWRSCDGRLQMTGWSNDVAVMMAVFVYEMQAEHTRGTYRCLSLSVLPCFARTCLSFVNLRSPALKNSIISNRWLWLPASWISCVDGFSVLFPAWRRTFKIIPYLSTIYFIIYLKDLTHTHTFMVGPCVGWRYY